MQFDFPKSFPIARLQFSQTAVRQGIDNTIPDDCLANACQLAWLLNDIDRAVFERWGQHLHLDSAYRSGSLNHAVGGATFPPSQHMQGLAADIFVPGVDHRVLSEFLAANVAGFDQIIHEFNWVHISIAPRTRNPRGERLCAYKLPGDKTTHYRQGFA